MSNNHRHWRTETDADNIQWLTLDKADSRTNVLSSEVLEEFSEILKSIQNNRPKAVVICSGKDKGFIAGADVKEFTGFESEKAAQLAVRRAHEASSNERGVIGVARQRDDLRDRALTMANDDLFAGPHFS